jgi:hypothetical protein
MPHNQSGFAIKCTHIPTEENLGWNTELVIWYLLFATLVAVQIKSIYSKYCAKTVVLTWLESNIRAFIN